MAKLTEGERKDLVAWLKDRVEDLTGKTPSYACYRVYEELGLRTWPSMVEDAGKVLGICWIERVKHDHSARGRRRQGAKAVEHREQEG